MADDLTAQDVMTDGVIAIDQDVTVQEAAMKMREEGIRSLVVLDDGEAVGIVVGRDIVYQVVSDGQDPRDATVKDVMTEDLVTASGTDEVDTIARAMIQHNISRVPILEGNQLVGIVTQSNIINAWPSYVDLLQEESQIHPMEQTTTAPTVESGECAACENYSEDLVNVDGQFLCPECRAEL